MKPSNINFLILILIMVFVTPASHAQSGDPANGAALYSQKCASCHGETGQGPVSLIGCNTCDSLESLYNRIDTTMPTSNTTSCIETCAWDTAAYIFEVLNGDTVITTSTTTAPR